MKQLKEKIILGLLLSFLASLFFLYSQPPKYYLSACAIFRNEARFLKEWIEYHRLLGVEHFYLFNHKSEDDFTSVLKPYIEQGVVELGEIRCEGDDQKSWNKIQCGTYKRCIEDKKRETFWLAIIDTDEFIVPSGAKNLREFLVSYEPYGGLAINWQLFGASVEKIKENQMLIESLRKKAPQDFEENLYVKSIVQPKKVKTIKEPHYCIYKKPFYHVTENQERFDSKSSKTKNVSIQNIRINHYTYRDQQFFYTEKARRIKQWFQKDPVMNPLLISEADIEIASFIPELKERLSQKEKTLK